jgi:hypothetical protein
VLNVGLAPLFKTKEYEENRFWSYWNMIRFDAYNFKAVVENLLTLQMTSSNFTDGGKKSPEYVPNSDEIKILNETYFTPIKLHLEALEFQSSLLNLQILIERLPNMKVSGIEENISTMRGVLQKELEEKNFIYIPKNKTGYFYKLKPFGEKIPAAFPAAVKDIAEAANCFALDRWNACVFHCMCVLECGLRVFAKKFGVKADHRNWENVINDIEKQKNISFSNIPGGLTPELKADLQFYSDAIKEFSYFKDAWRNYAIHGHEKYDESDALRILNHVKDFMEVISQKLNENNS